MLKFTDYMVLCFLMFMCLFLIGTTWFDIGTIDGKGNILLYSVLGTGLFMIIVIIIQSFKENIGL